MRTGEPNDNKKKDRKNTMKKHFYDTMITIVPEHELEGILRVAAYDPDIRMSEFRKLVERVHTIKEKCEEIGK